jgi:hypothetical protein
MLAAMILAAALGQCASGSCAVGYGYASPAYRPAPAYVVAPRPAYAPAPVDRGVGYWPTTQGVRYGRLVGGTVHFLPAPPPSPRGTP